MNTQTTKQLNLKFVLGTGKKYSIKIKDAAQDLKPENIKAAADKLIQNRIFDFDGKGSKYSLYSAEYNVNSKTAVIAAK